MNAIEMFAADLLTVDPDDLTDPDASLASADWLALMAARLSDIPAADVPALLAA